MKTPQAPTAPEVDVIDVTRKVIGDYNRASRRAGGYRHPIQRRPAPLPRYLRRHIESASAVIRNRRNRRHTARMERIAAQRGLVQ